MFLDNLNFSLERYDFCLLEQYNVSDIITTKKIRVINIANKYYIIFKYIFNIKNASSYKNNRLDWHRHHGLIYV